MGEENKQISKNSEQRDINENPIPFKPELPEKEERDVEEKSKES
jgi:hypothetical protein